MPKVTYFPAGVTVDAGADDTVLSLADKNGIPLEHACGGFCACSTCHVIVERGFDTLGEASDDELDQLDKVPGGPTLKSRLACQCKITADLVVTIPDSSRRILGPPTTH